MSDLEKLKNALLTFALIKVKRNDFDDSFDYDSFVGDKLPTPSGMSTSNACFRYMSENVSESKIGEKRKIAIEKYLDKNFDSTEKVLVFFTDFLEEICKE